MWLKLLYHYWGTYFLFYQGQAISQMTLVQTVLIHKREHTELEGKHKDWQSDSLHQPEEKELAEVTCSRKKGQ